MKQVFAVLGGLAALVALGWVLSLNGLTMQRYFAPRQEAIRRQTFEQSKAYNQGMVQELQNMQFQYEQADAEHRSALRSIILHRAADYDTDALPPSLFSFIAQLRRAQ